MRKSSKKGRYRGEEFPDNWADKILQMVDFMRFFCYNISMKTQEITIEKLTNIIEEKDRRIDELEKQVEWFLGQLRLSRHRQYGASSEQTDGIKCPYLTRLKLLPI